MEKLDDAKLLKGGIDRRRTTVNAYLKKYLNDAEFSDYQHFTRMKSKLSLELQEIDDQISLGEEQLSAVRKSMSYSHA